jgi:hypothetical protein
MSMKDEGSEFHWLNEAWKAVVASATDRNGAPSGFGIGF